MNTMVRSYSDTRDRRSSSRRRDTRYVEDEEEYALARDRYERKKSSRSRASASKPKKKKRSSKRSSSDASGRQVSTRSSGRGEYEHTRSESVRRKRDSGYEHTKSEVVRMKHGDYVHERSEVVREKAHSRSGRKKSRARDGRDDCLPPRRSVARDNRDPQSDHEQWSDGDSLTSRSIVKYDQTDAYDDASGDEYWEVVEYQDEPSLLRAFCCCLPDKGFKAEEVKEKTKKHSSQQPSSHRHIMRSNTSITTLDSENSLQIASSTSMVKYQAAYRKEKDDSSDDGDDSIDLQTTCSIVMYDTILMWKAPPPRLLLLEGPRYERDDASAAWKRRHGRPLQIEGPDPPKKGPSKADCASALEQLKKRQRTQSPSRNINILSPSAPMSSLDPPMNTFQPPVETEDQLLGKRNRSGSSVDPMDPVSFPSFVLPSYPDLQAPVVPPDPVEQQTQPYIEEIYEEYKDVGHEPKLKVSTAPSLTPVDPPETTMPTENGKSAKKKTRENKKRNDATIKGTNVLEKLAQAGIIMDRDKLCLPHQSSDQLSRTATSFLDSRAVHNSTSHFADPSLAKLEDELNFLRSMLGATEPTGRAEPVHTIEIINEKAPVLLDPHVATEQKHESASTSPPGQQYMDIIELERIESPMTVTMPHILGETEVTSRDSASTSLNPFGEPGMANSTPSPPAEPKRTKVSETKQPGTSPADAVPQVVSPTIQRTSLSEGRMQHSGNSISDSEKTSSTNTHIEDVLAGVEGLVNGDLDQLKPTLSEQSCMATVSLAAEAVLSTLSEDIESIIDEDSVFREDSIARDLKKERLAALLSKISFDARERTETKGESSHVPRASTKVTDNMPESKRRSSSKSTMSTETRSPKTTPEPALRAASLQQHVPRPSTSTSDDKISRQIRRKTANDSRPNMTVSSVTTKTVRVPPRVSTPPASVTKQKSDKKTELMTSARPPRTPSKSSTPVFKKGDKTIVNSTSATPTSTSASASTLVSNEVRSTVTTDGQKENDARNPAKDTPAQTSPNKEDESSMDGTKASKAVDAVVNVRVTAQPKVKPSRNSQGTAMARLVEEILKVLVKGSNPDFEAARAIIVKSKATRAGSNNTATDMATPAMSSGDPISILLKDIELFVPFEKDENGDLSSTGKFLTRCSTAIQRILSEHNGQAASQRKARRSAPRPEEGLGRMGIPPRRRKAKQSSPETTL